jgi:hypothetical protein
MIPVVATGQAADPPSWLTYASLGVAAVSACIALLVGAANRRLAKRALELSERQEARRESRVDVHLSSATSWRRPSQHDRLLGVHLLVSNPTDRATSVVAAEMHLTYSVEGVLTTVKMPPAIHIEAFEFPEGLTPAALPIRLEPNDAVSSLFIFRIGDDLTRGRDVERYDIYLRDVHGVEESRQITIFHEASG